MISTKPVLSKSSLTNLSLEYYPLIRSLHFPICFLYHLKDSLGAYGRRRIALVGQHNQLEIKMLHIWLTLFIFMGITLCRHLGTTLMRIPCPNILPFVCMCGKVLGHHVLCRFVFFSVVWYAIQYPFSHFLVSQIFTLGEQPTTLWTEKGLQTVHRSVRWTNRSRSRQLTAVFFAPLRRQDMTRIMDPISASLLSPTPKVMSSQEVCRFGLGCVE